MTKSVFAVAHSHWDHEWYFTQEDADMILIENLDYLIETLEENPEFPPILSMGNPLL
ncbi:glycosyl hydrolase, partial [Lacticaseibacillus paracasei subsp. paracasei Lpp126]